MSNFLTRDTSSKQLFGETFDLESLVSGVASVSAAFENGVISNIRIELVTIDNSSINNTVIGNSAPVEATFTDLTVLENSNLNGNTNISGNTTISSLNVTNCSKLGNIKICNNDIQSVNSNGNINIKTDGSGILNVYSPINNITSSGNFYSESLSGGATIKTSDDISLLSSNGNIVLNAINTGILGGLTINNNLTYSFERYTVTSSDSIVPHPNTINVITLFSINGASYNPVSSSFMPVGNQIKDGTFKIITCSSMGVNCSYTIRFAQGTLITPNPLNTSAIPTKIVFKRRSQSVQLIYDGVQQAWILLTAGAYIE